MELIINLKIQGCSDEYASINLSEPLSLSYSEDTTIGDLKSFVARQCGDEIVMGDVDLEYMGDERILINEIKLQRLVEFLETSDITLFYPCGRGGGYALFDGLRFYFHSNESGHTPHVHVDYQGESISIDLLTGDVIGKFKNPKKLRKARIYAHTHKIELMQAFNEQSHGISVPDFEVI